MSRKKSFDIRNIPRLPDTFLTRVALEPLGEGGGFVALAVYGVIAGGEGVFAPRAGFQAWGRRRLFPKP